MKAWGKQIRNKAVVLCLHPSKDYMSWRHLHLGKNLQILKEGQENLDTPNLELGILKVMKSIPLSELPMILALPPPLIRLHNLYLPGVPDKQIGEATNLALEGAFVDEPARKIIPFQWSNGRVLAMSITSKFFLELTALSDPVFLIPDGVACMGGYFKDHETIPSGWIVLKQLSRTDIFLVEGNKILGARAIPGNHLSGGATDQLIDTTQRSFQKPGAAISEHRVSGISLSDLILQGAGTLALGPKSLVRPVDISPQKPPLFLRPGILATGLLIIFSILLLLDINLRVKDKIYSIQALESRIGNSLTNAGKKAAPINRLIGLMGGLSQELPPSIDLHLINIQQKGKNIFLTGEAGGFAAIDALRILAGELPHFDKAVLKSSSSHADGRISFTLCVPISRDKL